MVAISSNLARKTELFASNEQWDMVARFHCVMPHTMIETSFGFTTFFKKATIEIVFIFVDADKL